MTRSLLVALIVFWTSLANAQVGQSAMEAAQALQAATLALSEAESATDKIEALTQAIRAHETGLQALRSAFRQDTLRAREIRQRFSEDSEQLGRLLAALQSIQSDTSSSTFAHPGGAVSAARAGMLVGDIAPEMAAEVAVLRRDLEQLQSVALVRESSIAALEQGLNGLQAARSALGEAVSARRPPPTHNASDLAVLQTLLAASDTLEAFSGGLIGAPLELASNFESARGALPWPVQGRLVSAFQESGPSGVTRPGWVVATQPRALVTAPWPSTVRYSGELLDFGHVTILEPTAGFLMVLAGLSVSYVETGTIVAENDPVGLTLGRPATSQDILIDINEGVGHDLPETLYIELRTANGPTDPADWFALRRE